jgi:hypothetical protein
MCIFSCLFYLLNNYYDTIFYDNCQFLCTESIWLPYILVKPLSSKRLDDFLEITEITDENDEHYGGIKWLEKMYPNCKQLVNTQTRKLTAEIRHAERKTDYIKQLAAKENPKS